MRARASGRGAGANNLGIAPAQAALAAAEGPFKRATVLQPHDMKGWMNLAKTQAQLRGNDAAADAIARARALSGQPPA